MTPTGTPAVDVDPACAPTLRHGACELPIRHDVPPRASRKVHVGRRSAASGVAHIVCRAQPPGQEAPFTTGSSGVLLDPAPGDEAGERCRRANDTLPAEWVSIGGRGGAGLYWAVDFADTLRVVADRSRLRWSSDPSCFADLMVPSGSGGDRPLAVYVHGGFWKPQWTLDTTCAVAADLVKAGHPVLNLEYPVPGGGAEDGIDMVRRVMTGTPPLVDRALDVTAAPGKVVLIGHSAGGQIAALLATAIEQQLGPTDLILQAPIVDVADAYRRRLGRSAAGALLPRSTSRADTVLAGLSPHQLGSERLGRTLLVHGSDDDRVPVATSRRFATARPEVTFIELRGAHHLDHLSSESSAWNAVRTWLRSITGEPVPA